MNAPTGILLIIVALLILYAAVTGKYAAFEHFFRELFYDQPATADTAANATAANVAPVQTEAARLQAVIDNARSLGARYGSRIGDSTYQIQTPPIVSIR